MRLLLSPFKGSRGNCVFLGPVCLLDSFAFSGHRAFFHADSFLHPLVNLSEHLSVVRFSGNSHFSAHAMRSIGWNNLYRFCVWARRFAVAVPALVDGLRPGAAAQQHGCNSNGFVHTVVLHNWPAQAYYNRLQWLSLAEQLMLRAANRACNEAMRAAAEGAPLAGKDPQAGAIAIIFGRCVAPSSPSSSPVSNHGATLARGVM